MPRCPPPPSTSMLTKHRAQWRKALGLNSPLLGLRLFISETDVLGYGQKP